MAAEIAESGAVARRQLTANASPTAKLAADLKARKPSFAVTIARGSSDHAALYLKHLVELKVGARLRFARTFARFALSCAAAACRRRCGRHFAVGPKPGHRRHAARGER